MKGNSASEMSATRESRWTSLTGPIVSLVVSAVLLVVAFGLDLGSETQRDAALLVGTVTLYVLAPLSVIWLIAALWSRAVRRSRSRVGDVG